jgi:glycosyltransferase involved in cell wall biosynthesis
MLVRNRANAKLSITRNTGIAYAQADYCFMLDADNILYPRCIEKLRLALAARADADAAYSLLEVFEGARDVIGAGVFTREGLIHGNFIDAMAMFRRKMLIELDGYEHMPHGWEDYDLWLRLIETGRIALHVPEILARYRQHGSSMLRTETNVNRNIATLHTFMQERHPWLELY